MSAKQEPESTQTAEVLANAAAEASKPGADTDSQYECPFCVMMRKGGCEEVFKAFMDCGEKADKGDSEMADCLPQFEQLHLCMEKNKAVFDNLLQEMKEEEALNKAAASASSRSASGGADSAAAASQQGGSDAAVSAGVTTHQQEQQAAAGSGQEGSNAGTHTVSQGVTVTAGSSMAAAS